MYIFICIYIYINFNLVLKNAYNVLYCDFGSHDITQKIYI